MGDFGRRTGHVSVIALCATLAACGGGSGGGGIASTPASAPTPVSPAPTPAPPPSNANSALTGALLSETFTNDAASGAATYNTVAGGISAENAARSPLSVVYDAATGSYTISVAGRAQTFATSDRVTGPGTSRNYRKVSGSVTDDLTLTSPGTSGALQYQYVGAGFWQRQTTGTSSIQGSFDAFTYGVETPDASLPRTGSAAFAVNVVGAMNAAGEVAPWSMAGSGSLFADFARATVTTDGNLLLFRQNGTRLSNATWDGRFSGTATLSSSANSFGGTISLPSIGGTYNGTWDGRFYGPTAQEVGAAFSATSATGNITVGTITGRVDSTLVSGGNTLAGLTAPTTFNTGINGIGYVRAGNNYTQADRTGNWGPPMLQYTPATQTYAFAETSPGIFGPLGNFSVGPAQRSATQSDARYTVYDVTSGTTTGRILIYTNGAANTELQLSYASFADIQTVTRTGTVPTSGYNGYMPFGIRTPVSQVPVSGTASYSGIIKGTAVRGDGALYTVGGTANFSADFATLRVQAILGAIGISARDGSSFNFGSFTYNNIIDNTLGGFSGSTADGSEVMRGYFYGPRANEIGATFNARRFDGPTSPNTFELVGVAMAKQN